MRTADYNKKNHVAEIYNCITEREGTYFRMSDRCALMDHDTAMILEKLDQLPG